MMKRNWGVGADVVWMFLGRCVDVDRGGFAFIALRRLVERLLQLRRRMSGKWCAGPILVLLAMLLSPGSASAQIPPVGPASASQAARPVESDPLGRTTPWGTVTGFIRASELQDFAVAAQYLDTRASKATAEQLARQLFTILDRGLTTDIDRLSRSPDGNVLDGLPLALDRVGHIDTLSGGFDVLVGLVNRNNQPSIWLFSPDTLQQVPAVVVEFEGFRLEAYIPRLLLETTLFSRPLYRWIVVPFALVLAWVLGSLVARVIIRLLRPLLRRLAGEQDDHAAVLIRAPVRLILVGVAIRVFSTFSITLVARQFWTRVAAAVLVIGVAWLTVRVSDTITELTSRQLVRSRRFGRIAVLGLGRGLFRALVVVTAALSLLHRAGVDLTAILTGLGIGGLGLALAAQKTLENLFGGLMIISDEPLSVGDFCKTGDVLGTVEDIGLRSTRIRTLSRTVVAVPNGQLAAMNIENYSRRDKFWLRHTLGVRYETTPDQMRHLLATVRAMLFAHPKVERDGARIRFIAFGSSSLDLEIFAYVYASEMAEFLAIQEDILLRVMDLIADSGTSVAFPSRTTYIARDTPRDAERAREAERKVQEWRDSGQLPFPDSPTDQAGILPGTVRYPPEGSAILTRPPVRR